MSEAGSRVVLGLGANIGDCLATLRAAVQEISALPNVRLLARSRVYETAALGPPQPDYLNAAVLVEYTGELSTLLASVLAIEAAHGRVRTERWGPRTLDIDILFAGERTACSEALMVPHPRLKERAFAILPLLDVAPDARDPRTNALYSTLVPDMVDAAGVHVTTLTL